MISHQRKNYVGTKALFFDMLIDLLILAAAKVY